MPTGGYGNAFFSYAPTPPPLTPEEEYLLAQQSLANPVPPPPADTSMYSAPVESQYQPGGESYVAPYEPPPPLMAQLPPGQQPGTEYAAQPASSAPAPSTLYGGPSEFYPALHGGAGPTRSDTEIVSSYPSGGGGSTYSQASPFSQGVGYTGYEIPTPTHAPFSPTLDRQVAQRDVASLGGGGQTGEEYLRAAFRGPAPYNPPGSQSNTQTINYSPPSFLDNVGMIAGGARDAIGNAIANVGTGLASRVQGASAAGADLYPHLPNQDSRETFRPAPMPPYPIGQQLPSSTTPPMAEDMLSQAGRPAPTIIGGAGFPRGREPKPSFAVPGISPVGGSIAPSARPAPRILNNSAETFPPAPSLGPGESYIPKQADDLRPPWAKRGRQASDPAWGAQQASESSQRGGRGQAAGPPGPGGKRVPPRPGEDAFDPSSQLSAASNAKNGVRPLEQLRMGLIAEGILGEDGKINKSDKTGKSTGVDENGNWSAALGAPPELDGVKANWFHHPLAQEILGGTRATGAQGESAPIELAPNVSVAPATSSTDNGGSSTGGNNYTYGNRGGGRSYSGGNSYSGRSSGGGRRGGGFSFGGDDAPSMNWRDYAEDSDGDGRYSAAEIAAAKKKMKAALAKRKKGKMGKRGRGELPLPTMTSPIRQNVLANLSSAFGRPVGGWPEQM